MNKLTTLSFISLFVFITSTDITDIVFDGIDDAVPAAYGR